MQPQVARVAKPARPALPSIRTELRAASRAPCARAAPVDLEIRAYLAGEGDGAALLHALYDHILDEPVPERLSAVVRP
jgi:hypothetical protein